MTASSSKDSQRPSHATPSTSSYLREQLERLTERPDETLLWSDLAEGLRNLTLSVRRRLATPARAAH